MKVILHKGSIKFCAIVLAMRRNVVGLLVIFSLVGCGAKNWGAQSEFKVAKNGYAQYGNFCGPGYPDSGLTNPEDDLRFLAEIEPYDLIDKTCKIHDMCYAMFPENHIECDYQLLKNLIDIYPVMPKGRCEEIVLTIGNTFVAKRKSLRSDLFVSAFLREMLNTIFYPLYALSGEAQCVKMSSYHKKLSGEEIILIYKR